MSNIWHNLKGMFGYFKVSGAERNGAEWNGTERNWIEVSFHCLGILRWNGTKFPLYCLDNERNRMNYNVFNPLLPLIFLTINKIFTTIIKASRNIFLPSNSTSSFHYVPIIKLQKQVNIFSFLASGEALQYYHLFIIFFPLCSIKV